MMTFLPYPDFALSLKCLDRKRLGNQRKESKQIIDIIEGTTQSKAWINHTTIKMWLGYAPALRQYYNINLVIWAQAGGHNIKLQPLPIDPPIVMPHWFGKEEFHSAQRSVLLAKNYEHYSKFGWKELPAIKINGHWPYWWPTKEMPNV